MSGELFDPKSAPDEARVMVETRRAVSLGITPDAIERLIAVAIERGTGAEALEKIVALAERMQDRAASFEFADALARFQAECPPIKKTSTAKVTTKSGGQYTYTYAELDEIAVTVRPILHRYGLSYSWDNAISENGERVKVICTLQHLNGHKQVATFEAPTKALTQAMTPQQEVAAALTFGKRQALIQVLGLTTTDPDTDGAGEENLARITPEQVEILEALIDKRPSGSRARLLAWTAEQWGAPTLEEIPARHFTWLKGDLERKVAAQ